VHRSKSSHCGHSLIILLIAVLFPLPGTHLEIVLGFPSVVWGQVAWGQAFEQPLSDAAGAASDPGSATTGGEDSWEGSAGSWEGDGQQLIEAVESALVDVIARCEQSVVAISRVRKDRAARNQLDGLRLNPSLQWLEEPTSEDFVPSFFGSGIVVDQDGSIATCAHVLDDPRKHDYYVWLDRRCYPAQVVGLAAQVQSSDPFSDLAVLRIEASDLQPIPLSETPARKGQLVVSLGNPYAIARDGRASASLGIISNVQRFAPREKDRSPAENIHQLGTLIQTDLRQPVGSSGGALVNSKGQLVGMTTNLLAARGYENSAGFAIAADELFERVIGSLKQGKLPEYGFLGIQPDNLFPMELDQGLAGARVSMVIPGLPGSLAGLREGDIIVQVGEEAVGNRNDLFRELSKLPTGKRVQLKVYRRRRAAAPVIVDLQAELTKKYIATNRPSFSLHGTPVWRGAQVEYQSAIAGELERISVAREGPKVALLSVAPDSPTWRAGLRAGYGLVSLNGQEILTPDHFHQLTENLDGPVRLLVISSDGSQMSVVVPPE
jgi:serine protease Do